MKQIAISFVIPAFNEEFYLPNVLKSIEEFMPDALSFEVVVADNGSSDNTVPIAEKFGATVLIDRNATVARLRNIAVGETTGEVLVFLDADISLTEQWGDNISDVYKRIHADLSIITGSRCGVPANPSWIESIWFQPLVEKPSQYINSGHLITSRTLFDKIGGFNNSLVTGEDYAFGVSAQALNATIVNNPLLRVVHHGYPKTVRQFVRREIWHGRGDCDSVKSVISSKVALTSFLFAMLHFILLVGLFVLPKVVTIFAVFIIVLMCVGSAVYRYKVQTAASLLLVSLLFYLYYFSRFLSCVPSTNIGSARNVKKS